MQAINRRKALTVVASAPAAAALATIPAFAGFEADPIIEAIAAHKAAFRKYDRLWDEWDRAEGNAAETHGRRPWELIHWRNYCIGEYEIDERYEWFLKGRLWEGDDPKQVEAEYHDAKRRFREAVKAGKDWDKRAGIAPLRLEVARARRAADNAARRLAKTKPTTARGAGALVEYVVRDSLDFDIEWHKAALKIAARSLTEVAA